MSQCSFDLCSDIVEKITNKAISRLGADSSVTIDYDDESVGTRIVISDDNKVKYLAVLAKLEG